MKKVLLDPSFRKMGEIFDPADRQWFYEMADVIWGRDDAMPSEEVEKVKNDLDAIVCGKWRYGNVENFPNLRAIIDVGGGLPSPKLLSYPACFAKGIRVASTAPAMGPQVAEMGLAMALAVSRQVVEGHNAFVSGTEKYLWAGNEGTFGLFRQKVGFIGFGGLARALKPLIDPFGCTIQAYDPWLPKSYLLKQGVKPVGLEELLKTSKFIFVLAIPTPENKEMLNRDLLSLIQADSVFVLLSRAHLVDFEALTDLLCQGRLKAAIDVFPQEPMPKDHPIRQAPGVVFSAHRAGSVPEELHDIGRMLVADMEAILAGLPPTEMQSAQPELIHHLG